MPARQAPFAATMTPRRSKRTTSAGPRPKLSVPDPSDGGESPPSTSAVNSGASLGAAAASREKSGPSRMLHHVFPAKQSFAQQRDGSFRENRRLTFAAKSQP